MSHTCICGPGTEQDCVMSLTDCTDKSPLSRWSLSTGDIQAQGAGIRQFGAGVLTTIQLVHDKDVEIYLHIIS